MQNIFFSEYILESKIKNISTLQFIEIDFINNNRGVYSHSKKFIIKEINDSTLLIYQNKGDFSSPIYNILNNYLIKKSCSNELKFIKKAIESSDTNHTANKFSTIGGL